MRSVTRWRRSGSRFGWLPLGLAAAVLTAVLASVALAQSPELEPPGRPQALQAVVSHDMVSLSWDEPHDSSISGYQILRRLRDHSPVGQFEVLVEDTGSAASAYVDRQVQPETRYNYRVKARNATGLSPRSNFVRADTPPAPVLKQAKQEQQEQEEQQQQEEQPEEQVDEPVTVWTGNLTVGVFSAAAPPVRGYAAWIQQGALAPRDFSFADESYTVLGLFEHGGGLNLVLGRPLPHDFVLELGPRRYESSQSLEPVFVWAGRYWWPDTTLDWAAGEELTVSITIEPSGPATERAAAPPSAYLTELPAAHNGRDPFALKLVFDEPDLPLTAALLRDHSLQVSGGSVLAVDQGRRAKDWLITLQPSGDGPLTVSLPSPADCADAGAVCAADGRKLRGRVTATIAGPPKLTALHIVGATLSPAFDPDSELFTAETGLEQVTVEAAADDPRAQLTISPADADPQQAGHQVALAAAGETTIEIELKSVTGETARVYWVVLRRSAAAPEPPSSGLNALSFSGLPELEFSEHESRFELDAPEDLEETTVILSRAESEAGVDIFTVRGDQLVVNETDHDPNAPGHQTLLSAWGDTLLLVRVTSGDGRSQRAYVTHLRGETETAPPAVRSGTRSAPKKLVSNGARDDDALTLSALSLSGAELTPAFASDVVAYQASVATNVAQVTITATPTDADATLLLIPADADSAQAGHQVDLGAAGSETVMTVIVGNAAGQLNSYLVKVLRQLSVTPTTLQSLVVEGHELSPAFAADVQLYRVAADAHVSEVTLTTLPAAATLTFVPADADPTTPGYQVALGSTGTQTTTSIAIIVSAPPAATHATYVVIITRAAPDPTDAALQSLSVDGHALTPAFDPETHTYQLSVPGNTPSVTLTAVSSSPNASLSVSPADADPLAPGHQIPLAAVEPGQPPSLTSATVTVTSEDVSATRTYTITITVEPAATITPTSLFVLALTGHTGDLSNTKNYSLELRPDFQPGIFSYEVAVPAQITHVAINATPWFPETATVKEPDGSLIWFDKTLGLGPTGSETITTYDIIVSSGRAAPSTYSITVTRAALEPTDAALYKLEVQHRRLIPRFEPDTYEYRLTVPDHRDTLDVDIAGRNRNASISVSPADADPQKSGYQIPLAPTQPGGEPSLTTVTVTVTSEDLSVTQTYTLIVTRRTPVPEPVTVAMRQDCALRELEDEPITTTWYVRFVNEQRCYGSDQDISRMYRMVVLQRSEINIELATAKERFLTVLDTQGRQVIPPSGRHGDEDTPISRIYSTTLDAGTYIIRFDATGWFSGPYGRYYTLNVIGDHVLRPSSRLLRDLQLDGVSLPAFNSYLSSYNAVPPAHSATMTTVTATPQAPTTAADITILPPDADLNTAGHQVELPIDRETIISVRVADSDGRVAPLTYTVTVPLDAEAAPTGLVASRSLDGVQLEWISPVKNANAITGYAIWRRSLNAGETELTLLNADTGNADVAYLDRTPTATGNRFEYQVVALRGSVVSAGSNLALIKYEHPSDSSLQSLSVQRALVPGFGANTITYEVILPAGTSTFLVDALPSSPRATISASPAPAHSSQGGFWYELPLSPAEGADAQIAVAITVASEDGSSSTTYTITVTRATGPAPGGFRFIEAGWSYACAIRMDGTSVCWNYAPPREVDSSPGTQFAEDLVEAQPQGGVFVELTGAKDIACGVRPDGETRCWGDMRDRHHTLQGDGNMTQQSGTGRLIDTYTFYNGLRLLADGSILSPGAGAPKSVRTGPYQAIGAGRSFGCGLDRDGHITCWTNGWSMPIPYQDVEFKYLGADGNSVCGVRADDSTLQCWTFDDHPYTLHANVPDGAFRMVDMSYGVAFCGVKVDGSVQCWAGRPLTQGNRQARDESPFEGYWVYNWAAQRNLVALLDDVPDEDTLGYTMVTMDRRFFACGLRTDHSIACWGYDDEYLASMLPAFESPWHDSALLVDLTVDNGALLPEFDRDVTEYELSVDNATSAITITPEVTNLFATYAISADTDATVIDDTVDLSLGANVVTITVTAADGVTTRDYTVTVTRAAAN